MATNERVYRGDPVSICGRPLAWRLGSAIESKRDEDGPLYCVSATVWQQCKAEDEANWSGRQISRRKEGNVGKVSKRKNFFV